MRVKQVNMWSQRLLCLILFFAITVPNISTVALLNTNRHCELFQEPCHVLSSNYNQSEGSFSNTLLSECIKLNQFKRQCFFPISDFKFIPLSGDTCQCSDNNNMNEQVPMFRQNARNSLFQRSICITPAILLYSSNSNKMILWEGTVSFFPPDHLKSISTTVLII